MSNITLYLDFKKDYNKFIDGVRFYNERPDKIKPKSDRAWWERFNQFTKSVEQRFNELPDEDREMFLESSQIETSR